MWKKVGQDGEYFRQKEAMFMGLNGREHGSFAAMKKASKGLNYKACSGGVESHSRRGYMHCLGTLSKARRTQ